jgi:hypothetical protein
MHQAVHEVIILFFFFQPFIPNAAAVTLTSAKS